VSALVTRFQVQLAAAVVHCIGVVVSDAFTALIVQRTVDDSRDDGHSRLVDGVGKGLALVAFGDTREGGGTWSQQAAQEPKRS
jgi:hypothetical protein